MLRTASVVRRRTSGSGFAKLLQRFVGLALAWYCLLRLLAHESDPTGQIHDAHAGAMKAPPVEATALGAPAGEAAPTNAATLKFRDFYVTPLGPRGLEFTRRIKALDGQRVRIAGFMVRSRHHVPGTLLLTPYVVNVDDCHYGLADDLPPQTLHVTVPWLEGRRVPFIPGPLLLTGKLELGPKEQPDGRNFAVRLVLESVASAVAGTASPGMGDSPAVADPRPATGPAARDSTAETHGGGNAVHCPNPVNPETKP